MGRITITLNDDLDKKLRETVAKTIGFKKGNLQVAIEQALETWIQQKIQERKAKR
jgi:predicted transcriptional regulator